MVTHLSISISLAERLGKLDKSARSTGIPKINSIADANHSLKCLWSSDNSRTIGFCDDKVHCKNIHKGIRAKFLWIFCCILFVSRKGFYRYDRKMTCMTHQLTVFLQKTIFSTEKWGQIVFVKVFPIHTAWLNWQAYIWRRAHRWRQQF